MNFLLPSIYKPFYINVLFVRQSEKFFVIIDVYNGIGLYDKGKKGYDVGSIEITFEWSGNKQTETLRIYRDKPLFNTSYKESITTVFTGFTISNVGNSKKLIVEYKSPDNEYGVQINRNIRLEVDLQNDDTGINGDPFYLYHGTGSQYYIWYDNNDRGIDSNLKDRVINKSNNFLYYVVNEGFYKYFIQPEYVNRDSDIYQSYNNKEVNALRSEEQRINLDLNPNTPIYNDGDGVSYLPTKSEYDINNDNYCITTPFFRMYPSISSVPKKKQAPFAVRLVVSGSTIVLENNIDGYGLSEEELEYNNFYLIGVKSPLTSLGETYYNKEYKDGGSLRPEQDYVTVIEFISRIKVLKKDDNGDLVVQEDYKSTSQEYYESAPQEDYEDE